MEETETTTEASEPRVTVQELVRPREGRVFAGVAQGIANRTGITPLVVRAAFILLLFAGGTGAVLYAAGWFLIRSEDEPESMAERIFSNAEGTRSWIGIALVFIAALILLDQFTFLSGGVVWAVGLLIVGFLLYTGDLPRLFDKKESADATDKEGVQRMTTDTKVTSRTEPVTQQSTPPSGGDAGSGLPPTPTPTPPILPPPAPHKPQEHSILGRLTIGFMLLGLGVLALLDNIPGLALEPEPRHYVALAVTILGIGLLVGAFIGRARWLIVVGVILVPTLLFSPALEYQWNVDEFESSIAPQSFEVLQDEYQLDVGNMQIDLRDLPWQGEDITLDVSVDAGNIEIIVPPGVAVTGSASVDVGRVAAFGQESSGLGNPTLQFQAPGDRGSVDIETRVDIGNIQISRRG